MPEIPDRRCPVVSSVGWQCRLELGHVGGSHMGVNGGSSVSWSVLGSDMVAAYRAGREDAARDLEAEADDEAQRPGRAEPSELIERWLREAAEIARGEDQDIREGRT